MIWVTLVIGAVLVMRLQLRSADALLKGLSADRWPECTLTEPGKPVMLHVTLENRGRWPVSYGAVRGNLPKTTEKDFHFSTWLLPRHRQTRLVPMTFPERGRYVLNDLTVSCGDYLGMKEVKKSCGSFREVVVAPKPLAGLDADILVGGFLGDRSVRRFLLEDPMLTLGFREYTGHEPMKRISWTQSARSTNLIVKNNDYTVEPSVSVLLNVETDLPEKTPVLETCYRAARTVCEALEAQGIRYSFSTNALLYGYSRKVLGIAGMGQGHLSSVLEYLGRASGERLFSLEELLERELQCCDAGGVILITPGGSETDAPLLRRLRADQSTLVLLGKEMDQ